MKTSRFCHIFCNVIMDVIMLQYQICKPLGLLIYCMVLHHSKMGRHVINPLKYVFWTSRKSEKQVSKYHNHTLHTITNGTVRKSLCKNINSHKTSGRQPKQSNQSPLFPPHQEDLKCKTRRTQKQVPNIEPPQTMGATINNESKFLEWTAA